MRTQQGIVTAERKRNRSVERARPEGGSDPPTERGCRAIRKADANEEIRLLELSFRTTTSLSRNANASFKTRRTLRRVGTEAKDAAAINRDMSLLVRRSKSGQSVALRS
jgi:hypothetical protein